MKCYHFWHSTKATKANMSIRKAGWNSPLSGRLLSLLFPDNTEGMRPFLPLWHRGQRFQPQDHSGQAARQHADQPLRQLHGLASACAYLFKSRAQKSSADTWWPQSSHKPLRSRNCVQGCSTKAQVSGAAAGPETWGCDKESICKSAHKVASSFFISPHSKCCTL